MNTTSAFIQYAGNESFAFIADRVEATGRTATPRRTANSNRPIREICVRPYSPDVHKRRYPVVRCHIFRAARATYTSAWLLLSLDSIDDGRGSHLCWRQVSNIT